MGRLDLKVPQLQRSQKQIPVEEIIQALGENPYAQGLTSVGNSLSQALAKRLEMKKQAEQVAAIAQMTGQDIPSARGLTPEVYSKGLEAKAALTRANKPLPTNVPYALDADANATPIVLPQLPPGAKPIFPKIPGQGGDAPIDVWQDPKSGQISREPVAGWLKTSVKSGTGLNAMASAYQREQQREMPTASTRSSAEFATTIRPHIGEMRDLIKEADARGYIGPASGRVYNQFLAGQIGSTGDPQADALLGKLRTTDSLLKTGAMRVHFGARGGQQMYDKFSELLNSGKQSAAQLNGSRDALDSFMSGYQAAGQRPGQNPSLQPIMESGNETPAARKARLLQELQNAPH